MKERDRRKHEIHLYANVALRPNENDDGSGFVIFVGTVRPTSILKKVFNNDLNFLGYLIGKN